MPQEMKMIEAIKMAIQTEKDVMDFYLKAASLTENERGKKVFEQLASEEREHAGHFFKIYTGSDLGSFEDFMAQPPSASHSMLKQLEKALDENVHERKAMERYY
jgi:rubrerythrin